MAAPVDNTPIALTRGKPTLLGTLSALNHGLQFTIPEPSRDHQGYLAIQASSGITTPVAVLQVSLDAGATWGLQPAAPAGIGGEGSGTLLTGDTAASFAATYVMSGLAGATLKFGFTGGTIGSVNVFALVG